MRKGYKWAVLAMLSAAYFFHQADRAIFGVLTPEIQADLGISVEQLGWINLALSWTIAIVTPLAGVLAARFSRKAIITLSILFWSAATALIGLVGNPTVILGVAAPAWLLMLLLRSLAVGGGESFYGPAAMALLASYHRETRSLAFALHQGAIYLGLMLSGVLVAAALTFLDSWREVFMAFGGAGLLIGIVFIFFLKDCDPAPTTLASTRLGGDPAADSTASQSSCGRDCPNRVKKNETPPSPWRGVRNFFTNPSALFATSGFVAIVCANNAYLFWGVKFAVDKFSDAGLTMESAKTATMLWHHVFAFAAILLGGVITDRFVKTHPRFRLGFQILSLFCGAPVLVWLGFAPTWTSFLVAGSLYGVFRGFFEVNTHASVFDVIAPRDRSAAVGCMLFVAFFLGGVLSGWAMGALSRHFGAHGFEIGFALTGVIYALAGVLMAISYFFTFRRDRVVES